MSLVYIMFLNVLKPEVRSTFPTVELGRF